MFGVAVRPLGVALMGVSWIGAMLVLVIPLAFFSDWSRGRDPFDIDFSGLEVLLAFALAATILFLAGLARAVLDRRGDGGCEWTYERNGLCEEQAERFARNLLSGNRRAAYAQLCFAAQEKIPFEEFDREWRPIEAKGARSVKFQTVESQDDDARRTSRHARLCSSAGVPFSIATISFRYRDVYGSLRVDLAFLFDEWQVLSWETEE